MHSGFESAVVCYHVVMYYQSLCLFRLKNKQNNKQKYERGDLHQHSITPAISTSTQAHQSNSEPSWQQLLLPSSPARPSAPTKHEGTVSPIWAETRAWGPKQAHARANNYMHLDTLSKHHPVNSKNVAMLYVLMKESGNRFQDYQDYQD